MDTILIEFDFYGAYKTICNPSYASEFIEIFLNICETHRNYSGFTKLFIKASNSNVELMKNAQFNRVSWKVDLQMNARNEWTETIKTGNGQKYRTEK